MEEVSSDYRDNAKKFWSYIKSKGQEWTGKSLSIESPCNWQQCIMKNLSFVRNHKDRVDYKSEEELKKLEQSMIKQPNKEILDHDRKRKVELKCLEMQELMEEQGYSQDEIEKKVSMFRTMLINKEGVTEGVLDKDEHGRPIAKETHQIAEANQEKNKRLKEAFGISEYYVDGSSLDPNRKAKEDEAKAVAMAQKKYAIVRDSSSSERSVSPTPKKRKKTKSREDSSDRESRRDRKKHKSKKHKHDRYIYKSSESKKSRNKHKKRRSKRRGKKRKRSGSPLSSLVSGGSLSDHDSSSDEDINQNNKATVNKQREENADDRKSPSSENKQKRHRSRSSRRSSSRSTTRSHSPRKKHKENGNKKGHDRSTAERSPASHRSPSITKKKSNSRSISYSPESRSKRKSSSRRSRHSRHHSRTSSRSRSSRSGSSISRSRSRTKKICLSAPEYHSVKIADILLKILQTQLSRSRLRITPEVVIIVTPEVVLEKRSTSIRRRRGSPSHLDRRRITSARKRPVPYYRPSPPSPSSISSDDSYYRYRKSRKGSRYRSLSRSVPLRRKRSWSRTSD
ncbi:SRM300 [Mytilus edulis]|uniref:SRRM2 n=1 Tax=Mytilus edulis TaxID=6550 RepID=A0A8S3VF16_MYTED|nr:SRM300 [Mytilus edulis]